MHDDITYEALADAFAFIGNSFLAPPAQTSDVGLEPEFWVSFPDFGSAKVAKALDELAAWAQSSSKSGALRNECATVVAVEFTRLFMGPPQPLAPPWETMNRGEGVTVGFGEATFAMRRLLREAGFQLAQEGRQYEDHFGIELLYLSELCRRAAVSSDDAQEAEAIAAFVVAHPLGWVDAFAARIGEAYPEGYYVRLAALAKALLGVSLA